MHRHSKHWTKWTTVPTPDELPVVFDDKGVEVSAPVQQRECEVCGEVQRRRVYAVSY